MIAFWLAFFVLCLVLSLFFSNFRHKKEIASYELLLENQREMREQFGKSQKLLQKATADLEQFTYIASHDLRAPLRGIGALSDYLKEDLAEYLSQPAANPDIQKNLVRLKKQARRMDKLVLGLVEYSRLDTEKVSLHSVNLEELIYSLVDALEPSYKVKLNFINKMPTFCTDKKKIQQVFSHLLTNSVKHHHDVNNIELSFKFEETESCYKFSVRDNGPGVDKKFHEKIFKMFQTLQSKDSKECAGVGLAIVKKIVDGLDGQISVDSSIDEGFEIKFDWPKKILK